jgi:hypothetical protein
MKWIAAVLTVLAISVASPAAATAKTCSAGYTHAIIGGAQKCLARGQYCKILDKRQYPKYGFACEDVDGGYRLEPKG